MPDSFTIDEVSPDKGSVHVARDRRFPELTFSAPVDPRTTTKDTIQLTYPDASGEHQPVDADLVIGDDTVQIWPKAQLRPGVTHTIRVKSGDEGVRSRLGLPLDATQDAMEGQEDGAWTLAYSTALDLESSADADLGCETYQTVRQAPLILDKPAVARVEARWTLDPDVHPSAQITRFDAVARMIWFEGKPEPGAVSHTFRNTDEGLDKAKPSTPPTSCTRRSRSTTTSCRSRWTRCGSRSAPTGRCARRRPTPSSPCCVSSSARSP